MNRSLVFLCAMLIAGSARAEGGEGGIVAEVSLRDTGYMLGDLIDERVGLPASMRVDPDSLPLPGRVAPWLEVRRARVESPAYGSQEVIVTYQIFAQAEEATRAPIPGFALRVRDGTGATHAVAVPERTFLLSPALPATLTDRDRELRPSPVPEPLPTDAVLARAAASLLVALACAVWLLWRYDRLPWLPRAPGPIVRTWRRWRRASAQTLSADQHAALLREVHAALSGSAGETLYPSTLRRLFERAPHLAPLRERIESVFAESWETFYGAPGREPPPAASVLALLRLAADRERGVPC